MPMRQRRALMLSYYGACFADMLRHADDAITPLLLLLYRHDAIRAMP